jgi:acyl-CoA thioesterase-1
MFMLRRKYTELGNKAARGDVREVTHMKALHLVARLQPILLALGLMVWANAASAQVVALGASNVSGWGVGTQAAFPAQLQSMLKAHGYNVEVANAGVAGDTTSMVLSRLDAAIPPGTKVAILDGNGCIWNNHRVGMEDKAGPIEVSQIVARLRAKGIKVVMMWKGGDLGPAQRQYDGIHLSEAGHEAVARYLLPQVMSALGSPNSRYASSAH